MKNKELFEKQKIFSAEKSFSASEFAAALLMPENDFIVKCKDVSEDGKIKIKDVAEYFNVSIQAATVRGTILGLWS